MAETSVTWLKPPWHGRNLRDAAETSVTWLKPPWHGWNLRDMAKTTTMTTMFGNRWKNQSGWQLMIQIICLDVNDNIFAFDLLRNANILLDDLTLYICERFWSYLRFRCSDLNSEKSARNYIEYAIDCRKLRSSSFSRLKMTCKTRSLLHLENVEKVTSIYPWFSSLSGNFF